ncbi:hypothetical protein JB92DRAFT_3119947 [Gautieria morchelliformis]|nr:hypothetical protein JB92DRAFT_3119947 [Gautieria morchelliformis]
MHKLLPPSIAREAIEKDEDWLYYYFNSTPPPLQDSHTHTSLSLSASHDASVEPLDASMDIDGIESALDSPLVGDDAEPESNLGEDSDDSSGEDSVAEEPEDEPKWDNDDINLSDDGYGSVMTRLFPIPSSSVPHFITPPLCSL